VEPPARAPERQRRLSEAERLELIDSYLSGEPTSALAKRFSLHRASASAVLKTAGVLKPLAKLSERQIEHAMLLRGSGLFYRQIAERMSVDTETVRRAVLKRVAAEGRRPGADSGTGSQRRA